MQIKRKRLNSSGFFMKNSVETSNDAHINNNQKMSDESGQSGGYVEPNEDNKISNPVLIHNPFISPVKKAPTLRRIARYNKNTNLSNSNKNRRGIKKPIIFEF